MTFLKIGTTCNDGNQKKKKKRQGTTLIILFVSEPAPYLDD